MLRLNNQHILPVLLRVAELGWFGVASLLAYWLRQGWQVPDADYLALTAVGLLAYGLLVGTPKHFGQATPQTLLQSLPQMLLAVFCSIGLVVMLMFLLKISDTYSRIWLTVWLVLASLGLVLMQLMAWQIVQRHASKGRWVRRVAIVGVDKKALDVAGHLLSQSPQRCKIVGLYATKLPEATATFSKSDLYKGSLEMLLQNRNRLKLDDVIVALDLDRYAEPEALFGRLHQLPVNTFYCLPHSLFSRAAHTQDATYRLPLILLFRHPLDGPELLLKRGLDLVGSVGFLLLLGPLMLAIALAIKATSPGPVFFRQLRGGFNGGTFEVLKFRSMVVAPPQLDETGKEMQATQHDARITRVGRWLRKSSLDELPQLLNVLRGEMSLVGPRPHALSHDTYYTSLIDHYASRHKMLPGLTGWAQLNGWRGETQTVEQMAKRVEFDIWYAEHWSWQLDVKILFLTPLVLFFQKRAY